MQVTYHSNADDIPAFRKEVVNELQRRLEIARADSLNSRTAKQSHYHGARITELNSLLELFQHLRLKGETH